MMLRYIIFIAILAFASGANASGQFISEDEIKQHLVKYITKTQKPEDVTEFKKIVEILKPPSYILRTSFNDYSETRQTFTCILCRVVMDTFKSFIEDGYSNEDLIRIISDICILMEMQTENVCRGAVAGHLPIMVYIIKNQPNWKSESFCGVTFQSRNPNTCPFTDENYEFQVELPAKTVKLQPRVSTGETFKVIHLSDLHYDPAYEPFGMADCNEPTCCRYGQSEKRSPRWSPSYDDSMAGDKIILDNDKKFHINLNFANEIQELKKNTVHKSRNDIPIEKQAGYWGDFRHCDAPWWAIEDSIDHVIENTEIDDFDLIYHTGDLIDHGVWETSKELITETVSVCAVKMKNAFGDRPVVNILGNHEAEPVNQFAPPFVTDPDLSSQWIYDMLIEEWGFWLPEETHSSMRQGGFYSMLVKPGLRAVVLNNNICYRMNWWIHIQPRDTDGQLAWLVKTLHNAEMNGERVHILSHIPPGRADCMQVYTREYKRILERFSDTVVAEFNGHTHTDTMKVYYEKNNMTRPFLVAWAGGSVTANSHVNPNYKVLEVDSTTFEIIDTDVWIFNLTEANLTPDKRPNWFKEYSFRETYGVEDMSPASIDALLMRMVTTDKNLLTYNYHIYRGKSSDPQMAIHCGDNCARDILTTIPTTELHDEAKGQYFWEIYQANNKKV